MKALQAFKMQSQNFIGECLTSQLRWSLTISVVCGFAGVLAVWQIHEKILHNSGVLVFTTVKVKGLNQKHLWKHVAFEKG